MNHLINDRENTAERRVIEAAYQAMEAQIKAEGLTGPDNMLASLETARVISTAAILYTFQGNKDIMFDVMDKYAESLKDSLKELNTRTYLQSGCQGGD